MNREHAGALWAVSQPRFAKSHSEPLVQAARVTWTGWAQVMADACGGREGGERRTVLRVDSWVSPRARCRRMSSVLHWGSIGRVVLFAALVGACGSEGSPGATSSGGGGAASGGNADSNAAGASSAGGPKTEGTGGTTDGEGCTFARAEAFDPGPPIPVRYTVFVPAPVDGGAAAPVPAYWEFARDCGSTKDAQGFDAAPWGDCVAQHQVDFLNHAFQTLMSTTKPMFTFESLKVVYDPVLGDINSYPDTTYAVERLQHSAYNDPPGLNVIVAGLPSFGSVEGKASVRQDFPVHGGVLVLVNLDVPAAVLTHEVGHVVGYGHADSAQSYPCCGRLSATPDICSENIMCGGTQTFNSCHQGEFMRKVAQCWWTQQGNTACEQAQCNTYTDNGSLLSLCLSRADGTFACTCQQNDVTYLAPSCAEARAQASSACL